MNAVSEGYYAGLVGDDNNPHSVWSLDFWQWHAGNAIGSCACGCAMSPTPPKPSISDVPSVRSPAALDRREGWEKIMMA